MSACGMRVSVSASFKRSVPDCSAAAVSAPDAVTPRAAVTSAWHDDSRRKDFDLAATVVSSKTVSHLEHLKNRASRATTMIRGED